ncbi:kinesin-like protein KIF22-A [Lingula anatina]|uniref:Kinesin-like protein n=1 Tax=Lingula anatina TaxID=7574 RepID=A0A1S3HUV0_LINAN|nr:kinesin-like protein KIF22-A [Lingula anatina]|eukprot:XP_013389820.1 kinesin-like protein KIF22-A [Lingula anatina]
MERKDSLISVVTRLRPVLDSSEKAEVHVVNQTTLEILNHRDVNENLHYEFSAVFGPESSQADIFNQHVRPLVPYVLNGENMTVFAYGPTGAGKTYTMLGTPQEPGVIPRTVNEICRLTENSGDQEWQHSVLLSYFEIYNEKVRDLLVPKSCDLPIREDRKRNIFVVGLTEKPVENYNDFKKWFGPASRKRTTASTKLNATSSRSHSIMMLKVEKQQMVKPYKRLTGKLFLIDLAGSENNKKTENKGLRLQESGAINKSLSVLSQVVDALTHGRPCPPYRSSKLTRILQDSLGGNSHTLMIVNIAPELRNYWDTYTTLNFAKKSKKIVNKTYKKETTRDPTVLQETDASFAGTGRNVESGHGLKSKHRRTLSTVPTTTNSVEFLSPILQRQTNLREEVVQRLESLGQNILERINTPRKRKSEVASHIACKKQHVGSPAVEALSQCRMALSRLQAETEERVKENIMYCGDRCDLPDSKNANLTNLENASAILNRKRENKESEQSRRHYADVLHILNKGSLNQLLTLQTVGAKRDHETFNYLFSDADVLHILNKGSLNQLLTLQTVGAKRAKCIHSWREKHGEFQNVDELRKITGLTRKYVDRFMESNFLPQKVVSV